MKLDPGMHIGMHLVYFGKSGVTLGDFHRKAPHRSDRCNIPVRPVSARKPQNTKQANRAPKRPKLETAAIQDNNEHTQMFT
jgi:hypothetical protein